MACITPFIVRNEITKDSIPVPCNKCPECIKRRTSGWSFRLMQEDKKSDSSMFITLTYDTNHVPITKNGFMDLRKRDIQLFFKRLRKSTSRNGKDIRQGRCYNKKNIFNNSEKPIKYYAVGEYGGKTMRPHYHIILFNAQVELIQPAWNLGHVHYGTVSGASVGYTLKYMMKPSKIPLHRNDDRQREFSLMSKGLGAKYLTPQMIKWHKADLDNRMYCNIEGGKKIAMPRYYKDKIYQEHERKRIAFFCLQRAVMEQLKKEKEGGIDYYRNKAEKDKEKFNRMKLNSQKGDKL